MSGSLRDRLKNNAGAAPAQPAQQAAAPARRGPGRPARAATPAPEPEPGPEPEQPQDEFAGDGSFFPDEAQAGKMLELAEAAYAAGIPFRVVIG